MRNSGGHPSATILATLHQRVTRALQAGAMAEAARLLAEAPIGDANFDLLRGIQQQMLGCDEKAVTFFEHALAVRAGWPEAILNCAQSLLRLRQGARATALLLPLLAHQPHAAGFVLLAEAYEQQKNQAAANTAWGKAIEAGAKNSETISNYWLGRRKLCDWSQSLPAFGIGDLTPAAATVLSDDPAFQRAVAEHWCRTRLPHNIPAPPRPHFDGTRRRRIGYLSSDIHHHATAYLVAELFALHDKNTFEVFCFSYGAPDESAIRTRIKNDAEHFVDLHGMSQPAALKALQDAQLDVMVDLKGHTRGHALPLLALRPAPIQIHYLGHPGTIGANFIDYLVGDATVTPADSAAFYTENILCHPMCYQINDRVRPVAETLSRHAYGLPGNAVVLACFNQTYKITPEVFALWCNVLQARPNTVLWLYSAVDGAADNLRAVLATRGIDPARLVIAGPLPNDQHLARYRAADVVVDTYPYGSHTTASDALWAGTPVVTRLGATYPSRVAASLLTNVGLPQLITSTPDEYTALILKLIDAPDERAHLRQHLNSVRSSAPLFDTPAWVKNWETLLQKVMA